MKTLYILFIFLLSLPSYGFERIVSLAPSITETLFDLGVGSKVVGTTEFSNEPSPAKKIPRIGAYQRPNIEKVISLKPDIVIGLKEGIDTVTATLRKSGIEVLFVDSKSLEDYVKLVEKISSKLGIQNKGKDVISEWRKNLDNLPMSFRPIPLIVQVGLRPLQVIGQETFLNELVEKCGGKNLVRKTGYPKLNRETLIRLKPEKVLFFGQKKDSESAKKLWLKFPHKKNIDFVSFDPDKVSRLTLRLAKNSPLICEKILKGEK